MLTYSHTEKIRVTRTIGDIVAVFSFHLNNGGLNIRVANFPKTKSSALLRLQINCLLADVVLDLGFDDSVLPFIQFESQTTNYSILFTTNVYAIVTHSKWPIFIANKMTMQAQNMVGYFTGKPTTVEQMGSLRTEPHGEVDTTMKMSDEEWTEPFELADDCVFCQKMTDESVADRIAGFQWAMDKEVANRFGAGIGVGKTGVDIPKHYDFDDTAAQRRAYHDKLPAFYAEHPRLLKVIALIDLPFHLQRILCIQWNHVVRDFIATDPRLIYRREDDMYFLLDIRRTESAATKKFLPSWVSSRLGSFHEDDEYEDMMRAMVAHGVPHGFL